jgi:hypothetical protein
LKNENHPQLLIAGKKKTQNSSQRTFTKKQVLQTDTKLSEEPSNLGPFWKKKQQLEMNMLQT